MVRSVVKMVIIGATVNLFAYEYSYGMGTSQKSTRFRYPPFQ
jgi:hypothetical protein